MEQPKLWTKTFIGGTLISFLLVLNYYLLMIIMTEYSAEQFGVSSALAGLSASMFVIGALAARFFSAQLMEKVGEKRLLLFSILLEIVSSALYFVSYNILLLFAVRFIHGMSYGMASTSVSTVVTRQVPAERRGEGVGYFMLSITLGAAIGPFLGMFLTRNGGYTYIFATCTAAVCICMVLALTFKAPKNAGSEAAVAVERSSRIAALKQNTAEAGRQDKTAVSATEKKQRKWEFFETKAIPISLICCGMYFCYSSIISYLTPYTNQIHLEDAATFFFIVYSAAILITRPFTGRMFDSRGARFTMLPAFASFFIGMILLSRASSGVMLLTAAAFSGYGVGVIQSSGLALAVESSPADRVGYANSTFYTFIDVGTGVGPFLLGFVIPVFGYRYMYLGMAIVTLVLTALFLGVVRKKKVPAELESASL